MMYLKVILLFCMSVTLSFADEVRVEMVGMSVIGNKESPNLLYIVPWKEANETDEQALKKLPGLFDETLLDSYKTKIGDAR